MNEWEELTMKLGGVLMTAERECTEEWMQYRDEVIKDAEDKIAELKRDGRDILISRSDAELVALGCNAAIKLSGDYGPKFKELRDRIASEIGVEYLFN